MKIPRLSLRLAALAAAFVGGAAGLSAQGVTTGAIAGIVSDSAGHALADVQISIKNTATGFVAAAITRPDGRYRIQNLEVGGPYTITARRIGLQQYTRDGLMVPLSQTLTVDIRMDSRATQLAGVTVISSRGEDFTPTNTGIKTAVSDTAIQRLPTLNRNLTDFIKLTPQVSQSGPGYSGGGMSNRMNNVQIDGSSERDVFGLGSTGQPGAEVNSKSVSIEAVKEFQVLLAPYDVRQGNFGGLLLNAVTKSGTNDMTGSAFYYYRNQNYGADTNVLRATPFNRTQFGFTLGGPIVRDRLHFFIAPEFTRENTPVPGPYYGTPNTPAFPVADSSRQRFESIMTRLGAKDFGTAGYTNIPNPLSNVFTRLDYRIDDVNRLVFHYNYSDGQRLRQQNNRGSTVAVYSSNFHDFRNVKSAPVLQLFSNFKSGAANELFFGYNKWFNRRNPESTFPQITINTGGVVGPNGNASIIAGADQFSQGNQLDTKTIELTDNYTFRPFGSHTLTVGTRNEYVWARNQFTQSSYGVWSFRNLDSLDAGNANSFRKAIILADGGNVYFTGLQNAVYAQDQWQVTPRFATTLGIRFDLSNFLDDIAYNAAIDSAYGRKTNEIPKHSLQFSPRFGFNWDVTGDQINQVRGGFGLFVGTPPYVWLENAYVNSGNIITFLNCNTSGSTAPAPAFQRDPTSITTCRNGQGTKPIGDVNFMANNLKFPQPLRGSLAYDRRLPWNLVATFEGMYSKTLNQLFFVNKNLAGVQGVSNTGRTLYVTTVNAANGSRTLIAPASVNANGGTTRFSTAVDLQNQSKDYSYNLTAQLRKRYADNWEGMIAYTYSHAYDVQSFTSSTAISNWQFGRTLASAQEDATLRVSLFDQPHKFVGQVTRTFNWMKNLSTDVTVFYQGVSGAPHDYIYGGSGGAGDLNGDGVQGNDLLYVPKNALDASEIQFRDIAGKDNAATQAQKFENFIQGSACLSAHRGQILPRNTCRLPFSNLFDVAIRQGLPVIAGNRVSMQLDIFNFGNMLNKSWGKQFSSPLTGNSNVPLVTHVGYSGTDPKTAVPIVQFTPPSGGEYTAANTAGNFWRTQISLRYSF